MLPISKEESLRAIARLIDQPNDGECWFPCKMWKGLQSKRILKYLEKKHYWDYGNFEGRHKFHPLVSYLLHI